MLALRSETLLGVWTAYSIHAPDSLRTTLLVATAGVCRLNPLHGALLSMNAKHSLLPFELPHKPNDRRQWTHLKGSSQALATLLAAQQHAGLTLVITTTTSEALHLESEIAFFNSTADQTRPLNSEHEAVSADTDDQRVPLMHFPDWETLPKFTSIV